jgi:hypothetical protein
LASNPSTPEDVLIALYALELEVEGSVGASSFAKNPSTPPCILRDIAAADDVWTRHLVAKNPSTPQDLLQSLSKDPHDLVVTAVGQNLTASTETLLLIARKSSFWPRFKLNHRPDLPEEVVAALAEDPKLAGLVSERHIGIDA